MASKHSTVPFKAWDEVRRQILFSLLGVWATSLILHMVFNAKCWVSPNLQRSLQTPSCGSNGNGQTAKDEGKKTAGKNKKEGKVEEEADLEKGEPLTNAEDEEVEEAYFAECESGN
ncbi:hypothetical protein F5882DRAFT_457458 [Hyaloscypha sp. PMI_1271]|nr:hypothetical protein F5882DRAFT_457458 [Hyaloscypha sp. PMI_1271]